MKAVNKRTVALVVALGALLCWAPDAAAFSSFYTSMCAGCHTPTVVGSTATTCNGCHAHGTHPDSTKSSINVTGATDAASYTPGQTVTVTINGGYRTGWIRAALFDQNMAQLAISTGPNGMGGGAGYPVTLTAPAPTAPGTYTWNVGWYGNQFDIAGAAFGPRFTPDPNNPNHGFEVVSTNSFTVAAAAAPAITLSPTSLDFGTVTDGTSATRTFTVGNAGTAALTVTVTATAGTSGEYTFDRASFGVSPGGSTTVTVTYAPTDVGTDVGSLTVASNDPLQPSLPVALSGTGAAATTPAPQIAVSPASLDFGTVTVGQSADRTFTISNGGTAQLTATLTLGAGSSPGFTFTPATATVAAGGSQAVTVTFAASAAGAASGSIVITSNDTANPSVTVGLTATGSAAAAPAIALDPASLDFGQVTVGQSGQRTVAVRNQGTATLNVSSIALCTGTSAAFTWSPAAPFAVSPGGATQLTVTYAPTAAGTDTGCLTVASDDPAHPSSTLALSAAAVAQGTLAGDVDIDELEVAESLDTRQARTVTPRAELKNRGTTAATATATLDAVLGGAAAYHQAMPVSVAAGQEAELAFPPLSVPAGTTGAIVWTLTVDDANPDVDRATATTRLR
ncbi:MAG TPA: choice-of-anchor D domain-containing protein, partial [Anaeromyxobacteraceae bacterium]|nr:choice-of-anchor D domain-containing protein [Anaeromyxobacteraceae bacterium]